MYFKSVLDCGSQCLSVNRIQEIYSNYFNRHWDYFVAVTPAYIDGCIKQPSVQIIHGAFASKIRRWKSETKGTKGNQSD